MAEVKNAIAMAEALHEFISVIRDYKITNNDIEDLSFFKPEVKGYMNAIAEWVNDGPVDIDDDVMHIDLSPLFDDDDNTEIINDEPIEPIMETSSEPQLVEQEEVVDDDIEPVVEPSGESGDITVSSRKRNPLDFEMMAYFIAQKYNGMSISVARHALYANFPNISQQKIIRFISKKSYKDISDKYFTLEGKTIRAIEGFTKPPHMYDIETIIAQIKNRDAFDKIVNEFFKDDEWKAPLIEVCKYGGDTDRLVSSNPELTFSELVAIEAAKKAAITGGLMTGELQDTDKAIIVGDAIKSVGKRKVTKIRSHISKRWNMYPNMDDICKVLGKKIVPELCNKFFA